MDTTQQLRDIRESWGNLLTAITLPPAPVWPPRQLRHQLDATESVDCPMQPAMGRLPLVLRQHPAPANLTALDAALSIETALFDLADRIAASVQHSVADPTGPDRWHYPAIRDRGRAQAAHAGSRVLGLHWCAVWLEDRLNQAEPTDLHGVVRGVLRDHAERVTAQAHAELLRALGRDERAIPANTPCPWCHGQLTTRTTSGDPDDMTITCNTGPTCSAPAQYDDRARRTWHGRQQIRDLMIAILHAQETAA